jgi:hypothetical protein
MNSTLLGGAIVIGAAGTLYTIANLREDIAMEGQHWIMLAVILVAGYVAGRLFPQVGQTVGLP